MYLPERNVCESEWGFVDGFLTVEILSQRSGPPDKPGRLQLALAPTLLDGTVQAIDVTFEATGKVAVFHGALKAYEEPREDTETRHDDHGDGEGCDAPLVRISWVGKCDG